MNNLILSAAIPLIIGPLTFVVMQGLKALSLTVDKLPLIAKRFAVAAIAILLTLAANAAGVDIACDPNGVDNCLTSLDKEAVKAILAAAIAYLLHLGKKKS